MRRSAGALALAALSCASPRPAAQPAEFPTLRIPATLRECAEPRTKELAALEAECRRDAVCGCAALGSELLGRDFRDRRGVRLVVTSCNAGSQFACDVAYLIAALCSDRGGGGGCEPLRAQGLVTAPERPKPAARPAGCYRLAAQPAPAPCEADAWWCAPSAAPPIELYCLEDDRLHTRARDGSWDEWRVVWSRRGPRSFVARAPSGSDLELVVLGKGSVRIAGVSAAPVAPDETRALLAERGRAVRVEVACRAAADCRRAVDAMLNVDARDEEFEAPASLAACEAERRAALARLSGTSGAVPAACDAPH